MENVKFRDISGNRYLSLSFYNRIILVVSRWLKIGSSGKNETLQQDFESHSEFTEAGQTFENKCFKKASYTRKTVVPLSNDSLRKSIATELMNHGQTKILIEIADHKTCPSSLLSNMPFYDLNLTLLWSVFCKQSDLTEELVRMGADVSFAENLHGLAALHVAAFRGCVKCAKFLIMIDHSTINMINKCYSPLHCAALGTNADVARILLDNGARLNALTNGHDHETALSIAVKVDAVECVKLFLEKDAVIYHEGKLGDSSPLFLAAQLGHRECLRAILQKKNSTNWNELRKWENGNTALHVAAEHGHQGCIEVLLQNGANPNILNLKHQSPLHLAVKANAYACVIALIRSEGADLNLEDFHKRTPLHEAVELIADSRKNIVEVLVQSGAEVNVQDQHGFTPLHIAALNELSQCAIILINNGADYSLRSKSGVTAFSLIAKKIPAAFQAIKDKLTEFITLHYHSDVLNDVEMKFDFKNGLHHPKEYFILNSFIDAGHKEMLLHPYIMAFLYITWGRIRRCYYGMIYTSLIFSLFLLFYVLTARAFDCDQQLEVSTYCQNQSLLNHFFQKSPINLQTQWYILLCFTLSLVYRKIYGFYGYPSVRHYFTNWGNVLEWHSIVYVFVISFIYTGRVQNWQIHAGAFAVICSWTNIMYQIGQLPVFGPYVEMFQKVQSEFQKLLLVFFPFLVGFTMSFCIVFPNSSAFYNPLIGFISTLVMMTGDLNYNILLDYSVTENSSNLAKFSSQLIYMLFLLFVTIILMNLLVGIAVHDIQGLQKTADLSRLVRQAKMCCYIERSHYNRSRLAKSVMRFLRVVPRIYIPVLTVKPLDPEDTPIPKEFIQAAYNLAKIKEGNKKNILNRTRSEGDPWKFVQNWGTVRRRNVELILNQLIQKADTHNSQIKELCQEVKDLKTLIQNNEIILTPVVEER